MVYDGRRRDVAPSRGTSLFPAEPPSFRSNRRTGRRHLAPFDRTGEPGAATSHLSIEPANLAPPSRSLRSKGRNLASPPRTFRSDRRTWRRYLAPFDRTDEPGAATSHLSIEPTNLAPPPRTFRSKGRTWRRYLAPFDRKDELGA